MPLLKPPMANRSWGRSVVVKRERGRKVGLGSHPQLRPPAVGSDSAGREGSAEEVGAISRIQSSRLGSDGRLISSES